MASKINEKIIVLAGQTAAGKTDMAIKLAEKYTGEIIAADSRTIYRGTDIGTAKPSTKEREQIKHHMLDVVDIDQSFSASDFKKQAQRAVSDIISRGKIPIIVGGTGLYINSYLYDFKFGKPPNPKLRADMELKELSELQNMVKGLGILPHQINMKNRRHLIRAIENGAVITNKQKIRDNTLFLGISVDQEVLKQRINLRIEQMIEEGLETEISGILKNYSWGSPGLNSIGYSEWKEYFAGTEDIDEVKKKLFKDNWQYARRQKIWFKRDENINWITSLDEAIRQVDQFLIQLNQ